MRNHQLQLDQIEIMFNCGPGATYKDLEWGHLGERTSDR